jgi:hypothetical protein
MSLLAIYIFFGTLCGAVKLIKEPEKVLLQPPVLGCCKRTA